MPIEPERSVPGECGIRRATGRDERSGMDLAPISITSSPVCTLASFRSSASSTSARGRGPLTWGFQNRNDQPSPLHDCGLIVRSLASTSNAPAGGSRKGPLRFWSSGLLSCSGTPTGTGFASFSDPCAETGDRMTCQPARACQYLT